MPLRKILLRVLLGSLAVAALCGAGGVLMADLGAMWRIALTALWTAAAAGLMQMYGPMCQGVTPH